MLVNQKTPWLLLVILLFVTSAMIPPLCWAGTQITRKCDEQTGSEYTACVDDGLGDCTTATKDKKCGVYDEGDCVCKATSKGCKCNSGSNGVN